MKSATVMPASAFIAPGTSIDAAILYGPGSPARAEITGAALRAGPRLHPLLGGWRPGIVGAVRMGVEHGGYCVGCCWGLMLLLFALGVMSLFWMAVVATLIFAQKVLPFGLRTTRVFAVAFLALGLWVAVWPASVPGLKQPTQMQMRR